MPEREALRSLPASFSVKSSLPAKIVDDFALTDHEEEPAVHGAIAVMVTLVLPPFFGTARPRRLTTPDANVPVDTLVTTKPGGTVMSAEPIFLLDDWFTNVAVNAVVEPTATECGFTLAV